MPAETGSANRQRRERHDAIFIRDPEGRPRPAHRQTDHGRDDLQGGGGAGGTPHGTAIGPFVANAGGLAYSGGVEINGSSADESGKSVVARINAALERAFNMQAKGTSLTRAADRVAEERLRACGFKGAPIFVE